MQQKILLAATIPSSFHALQELYGHHFTLKIVTRLDEAVNALNLSLDGILCNIHFDEGRLFDLLRIAKLHSKSQAVPFFVIDASPTPSSPAITQSISIASKTLGAEQVIHMTSWIAELGEDAARQKVLRLVLEYIDDHKRSIPPEL